MTSASPTPMALPCVSAVRSHTIMAPTRGAAASCSPATPMRPVMLGSMPTPLMSLPMRSTTSTSTASTGRRGMWRFASCEQSRLFARDRIGRQHLDVQRLVKRVFDEADARENLAG